MNLELACDIAYAGLPSRNPTQARLDQERQRALATPARQAPSPLVPDRDGWWWLETPLETLPVKVEAALETGQLLFRLPLATPLPVSALPAALWHGPCLRSQP